jgi:hypothetical protein
MAKKHTPPTPTQIDYIERRVWSFCWTPDEQNQNEFYIHPNTMFDTFKAGQITDLTFHQNGLAGQALITEIEIFAAHLNRFLIDFDISPTANPAVARGAIRDVVSDKTQTIQTLLDAVVANYREN